MKLFSADAAGDAAASPSPGCGPSAGESLGGGGIDPQIAEMLAYIARAFEAMMKQQQQASQEDGGVQGVGGGAPGCQAPGPTGESAPAGPQEDAALGEQPAADDDAAAPAGDEPDTLASAAADTPATSATPPAGAETPAGVAPPAQASGAESGAGALSTRPQTSALTADQSQKVAGQWKDNLKQDFGLTDAQAAGVVGNLWHESGGMNAGINQGGKIGAPTGNMADDNGNGYGIAQWGGSRKQGLMDYAQKNGLDPSSQAANYGYLKQELSGPYADAIKATKETGDVASATAAFCNAFEKPSDPQMASRVAYAQQVA